MKTKDCLCENGEMCWHHRRLYGMPNWCSFVETVIRYNDGSFRYPNKNIKDLTKCPNGKPITTDEFFKQGEK